jgi:hypothetical protein
VEDIHQLIEKVKADIQEGKSDDEIFQSLSLLLGKNPEDDFKFFDLLATIPHVKIVGLLRRLLEISDQKKAKKMMKRSLYRLKAKGIVLEEVPVSRGESILRPLQAEPPEGFGSGIDLLGQRLLMLVIPSTGRRWTVMEGVVSDRQGLIDFSRQEMTRREFANFLRGVREKTPFPLVEMEPSYAGFLFHQAYQLAVETGGAIPPDYPRCKGEIEKIKKEYERPLIYSYIQEDEVREDDRLLKRSGDLLKIDLLETWKIEEDQIMPYVDAVREAEESRIVLSQAQKEARFHEVYQKALADLFLEEKRLLIKRRLEETAYLLFKLGKEEEARISLAAALDLEKPPHPLQPNPFLYQFVVKSIIANLAEAYEKKKDSSLIVKP